MVGQTRSRDMLLAWLLGRIRNGGDDAVRAAFEYALTVASSWIPVQERWPEDNVDVLVRRQTACGMRSVAAYRSSGRDCWTITDGDYSEFYDHSVTHWMPLPEPPEVK